MILQVMQPVSAGDTGRPRNAKCGMRQLREIEHTYPKSPRRSISSEANYRLLRLQTVSATKNYRCEVSTENFLLVQAGFKFRTSLRLLMRRREKSFFRSDFRFLYRLAYYNVPSFEVQSIVPSNTIHCNTIPLRVC